MKNWQLTIINKVDELQKLNAFLNDMASDCNLPDKLKNQLNLVLEEIISNIIFYAYDDSAEHEIKIELQYGNNMLEATITDSGKAFDILAANEYDEKEKPAEERSIGGLGIHFVKELMDRVEYKRLNNKNILKLYKQAI